MKISLALLISIFLLTSVQCSRDQAVAFRISEKDLFPEGIAFSSTQQKYYLSSIHKSKILELDAQTGKYKDFINPHQFGYLPGVGMCVDEKQEVLWAIGSDNTHQNRGSKVFLFNLKTKQLIRTYAPNDSIPHFLNDLVLDSRGNAFITDTYSNSIYHIKRNSSTMELFYRGTETEFPNGITISPDDQLLYIASYSKGIRVLNIQNKMHLNQLDTTLTTKGIDGLKYYKGSLIGVQNGFGNQPKILKFHLDKTGINIIQCEILDEKNDHFDIPTTLVINKDRAYCIANSQLPNLNQKMNQIIDSNKLHDVVILHYDL